MAKHNDLGQWGEQIAERFLRAKGYEILFKNYRIGRLELDLVVCQEPNELVIVEVKTRTSDLWQDPLAAVGKQKQIHLMRAGNQLIHTLKTPNAAVRFDLISIVGTADDYQISHIEDAFYPF
ncbi:MAG: YraN family protein [Bacteroidetes bacterium]|nr:YraN family protein [Bacteroidota bacterium]